MILSQLISIIGTDLEQCKRILRDTRAVTRLSYAQGIILSIVSVADQNACPEAKEMSTKSTHRRNQEVLGTRERGFQPVLFSTRAGVLHPVSFSTGAGVLHPVSFSTGAGVLHPVSFSTGAWVLQPPACRGQECPRSVDTCNFFRYLPFTLFLQAVPACSLLPSLLATS